MIHYSNRLALIASWINIPGNLGSRNWASKLDYRNRLMETDLNNSLMQRG